MKIRNGLLIFTFIIAFALRFYRLGEIPPSLSWDEVSIGYNAYSILLTGRDEHGKFMPLDTFISYGDYKPPLSIYLTVPFVAVFGLNDYSVRFPTALFGSLTVIITYLLVKELLKFYSGKSTGLPEIYNKYLPLITALILSVSPWHLNLSRAGFEATIALFLVVLGVYLILRAGRYPGFWVFAWWLFVLSIYTFNSARYFVPLLAFTLIIYLKKQIMSSKKLFAAGIIISVFLILPIIPHLLSPESRLRFKEVNIFTDSKVVTTANRRIEIAGNTLWAKIIHNRRIGYAQSYLKHFFDHFQPNFLFIEGDGNPKFSIRETGQLYILDAPFLILGIYCLFSLFPGMGLLLLTWMISSIIPAATARETPHALRILNSLPTWHIFIAAGIVFVYGFFSKYNHLKKFRSNISKLFILFLLPIYALQIVYYLHNYYIHYPVEYSSEWQYGYREAVRFSQSVKNNYDRIVMSEVIGRPYMYTLFYAKFNPEIYIRNKNSSFDAAGFYHVYGFDKYVFREDISASDPEKTLYILPPNQVPGSANIIRKVNLLNGQTRFVIFEI